jgi:hypothetical protein
MNSFLASVFVGVLSATAPPAPIDWPFPQPMHAADAAVPLGQNLSGLAFDGTAGLWAVRDSGALVHLDRSGAGWKRTEGASGERALRYPGGDGSPDAEGITTVATEASAVFVAVERDNDASNTSRKSILRFDTSGTSALTATQEWKLDAVLGPTPANTGVESVAWIADSVFVSSGFKDAAGKVYAPADYPDHGTGLFATALESRGEIVFLALRADGTVTQVGKAVSGLDAIMDLSWNDARNELWVTCDSHCNGQAAVLRPADGTFQIASIMRPPAGMDALNLEGFAIVPTCTNNTMPAIWSDDSATAGISLREAAIPCSPLASVSSAPATAASPAAGPTNAAPPSTEAAGSTIATSAATALPVQTVPLTVVGKLPVAPSTSNRLPLMLGLGAVVLAGGAIVAFRRRP